MSDSIRTAPRPAPAPRVADQPHDDYRPLSLLALGGFVLSIFCAFWVLLGGLVPVAVGQPGVFFALLLLTPALFVGVSALRGQRGLSLLLAAARGLAVWAVVLGLGGLLISARNPWPLGLTFWGLLLVGIVLSWLAQIQIQGSEGTLSGEGLARGGLFTGISVAAVYGAYLASSNLALQAQARAAASDFLTLVRNGDDLKAFLLTIPPGERPQPGQERDQVEALFNIVTPPADAGEYTLFCNNPLFQLLRMAGKDLKLTERRLSTEFNQGTYYSTIEYAASSPFHSFEFTIGVAGQDVEVTGAKRRQWFVLRGLTKLNESAAIVPTERGQELSRQVALASKLLAQFVQAFESNNLKQAFLLTRPTSERQPPQDKQALASPAYSQFIRGKELGLDEMWTPSGEEGREIRKVLANLMNPEVNRQVVSAPELGIYSLQMPDPRSNRFAPRYSVEQDQFRVIFEVGLLVRDSSFPMPRYQGQVAITVSGSTEAKEPEELQVREIKLIRASKPPVEDKAGPGKRGPRRG